MWQEINANHAAFNDTKFSASFPTLTMAVNMHRLVLVAVEENIQPEVFVELGHLSLTMWVPGDPAQGRLASRAVYTNAKPGQTLSTRHGECGKLTFVWFPLFTCHPSLATAASPLPTCSLRLREILSDLLFGIVAVSTSAK